MISNKIPDLTFECGELLKFVSNVAIDIRLYSAYSNGIWHDGKGQMFNSLGDPNTPLDLMYLADILHNLWNVGDAIQSGNAEKIIRACAAHIEIFEAYLGKNPAKLCKNMKGNPTDTFQRHKDYVDLEGAIQLFKKIKSKCSET
jgi:hypothetical protein